MVNFKTHKDTTVNLSRLTVLLGRNGTGKTSVLDVLRGVSRLEHEMSSMVFRESLDPAVVVRHHPEVDRLELAVSSEVDRRKLVVRFDPARPAGPGEENWQAKAWRQSGSLEADADATGLVDTVPSKWGALRFREREPTFNWPSLSNAGCFRFDSRVIGQPSFAAKTPTVSEEGRDVGAVLAHMKLNDDPAFDRILEVLRRIVPSVRALRAPPGFDVPREGGAPKASFSLVFDTDSGRDIPAHAMSEGTLIVLALLTVLHSPARPRLVLLDDIHDALHPVAQIELMEHLMSIIAAANDLQIVATTHSPFIVDGVPPEHVQVFARNPSDGTSVVKPLSEHPAAKRSAGRLSTGQLWTLDREEDWVLAR